MEARFASSFADFQVLTGARPTARTSGKIELATIGGGVRFSFF